jgi:processive 1,2-diacylglycerol beta-glucosyltransferase
MTIELFDNETGTVLGTITESQLQFLIDQLEEESSDDRDYYLIPRTLELLEQRGADAELLALLRAGLGEREGFEIRWER